MHNDAVGVLTEGAETYERIVVRLKVLKRRIGKLATGKIVATIHAGRNVVVEKNQPTRIAHGQRLQHHRVDEREDGRIRADTERERKHGNGDKNGSIAELPEAVAKIVRGGFEQGNHAGVRLRDRAAEVNFPRSSKAAKASITAQIQPRFCR